MKGGSQACEDLQGEHCGREGQQKQALGARQARKANEQKEASMAEGGGSKEGNEAREEGCSQFLKGLGDHEAVSLERAKGKEGHD